MKEIVYQNPWFQVEKEGNFHFVSENGSDRAAAILAMMGDKIALLEMKRPAQQYEMTLEIPRGGASGSETVRECALRELKEETGYEASLDSIEFIGAIRPNTAILTSRINVFAALLPKGSLPIQERDDESVGLRWMTMMEIHSAIREGLIEDSFTLSALSLLNVHLGQLLFDQAVSAAKMS